MAMCCAYSTRGSKHSIFEATTASCIYFISIQKKIRDFLCQRRNFQDGEQHVGLMSRLPTFDYRSAGWSSSVTIINFRHPYISVVPHILCLPITSNIQHNLRSFSFWLKLWLLIFGTMCLLRFLSRTW